MKILCFGSLNLDYVYQVDHIVKPGETISSSSYRCFDGGKGLNQAIALGRANAPCDMAGVVGQDGTHLLSFLSENGVNPDNVSVSEGRTGHTIIQVDKGGQNSILYFAGSNNMVHEDYIKKVLSKYHAGDFILLQNEISNIPLIMTMAKEKGLKIVFNPSPITSNMLQYPLELVDLFILNEIEGFELTQETDEIDIVNRMHEIYPRASVLLTLGKRGSIFSDGEKTYKHGIYDVKAVDTTAAGDTFTGYFLASYVKDDPIPKCMSMASAASGLSVSKQGASSSIPFAEEVINNKMKLLEFV